MPSVWIEPYQNKRGKAWIVRWQVEIRDPATGKLLDHFRDAEACGPSKPYAEKRKTEIRDELEAGRRPKKRFLGLDLFTLLDRYDSEKKGARAANTYANWIHPAVEGFKAWKKNTLASMIEQKDFVDWRNAMTEEGLAPATVKGRLRDIMIAFAWAVDQDLLDRHPVRKRKDIMPQVKPAGRYITTEEVAQILEELPARPRQACYLVLHQGVRKEEMLRLDWRQVYTKADPWVMEILPGKNGDAREVTVHANVAKMLGVPRAAGQLIDGLTEDILDNHLPDALRRIKARGADLGRVRLHDFRHTWATNFMWKHGDVFRLMREGGWRSLAAAKVYQHFTKRGNVPEYPEFSQYSPNNTVPRESGARRLKAKSSTET
jgi:integrase